MRTLLTVSLLAAALAPSAPADGKDASPAVPAHAGISPPRGGLPDVKTSCRRMLKAQEEVLCGCVTLRRAVDGQGGEVTPAQAAQCFRLATRQDRTQWEAVALLRALQKHTAATAFAEVVADLVRGMEVVRQALARAGPDGAAVDAARELVETLRDAVGALERARCSG